VRRGADWYHSNLDANAGALPNSPKTNSGERVAAQGAQTRERVAYDGEETCATASKITFATWGACEINDMWPD
jgi:hypothetical protein